MREFDRMPMWGVHIRSPPCGCTRLGVPWGKQPPLHDDLFQRVEPLPVIRVVLAFPSAGRGTRDLSAKDTDPFVPTEISGLAQSHDERERLGLPRSIECPIGFVALSAGQRRAGGSRHHGAMSLAGSR
ncbi:MAG: hypothetical protein QOJ15_11543 [Bradyrhizobium sp.]|nr:hypothetical protein [Bradyrhizobium sp.]